MKAPTYILKRTYLESNMEKEYQKHISKLDFIKKSKININSKSQQQMSKIEQMRNNKMLSHKFNKTE